MRSSAIALTATGDRDLLRSYVTRLHDDQPKKLANLTNAYRVGELGPVAFTDDTAMIRADPHTCSGERLLGHLLDRLQPIR